MERNDKSIEAIVETTIALLRENDEPSWANYLSKLLLKYKNSNTEIESIREILKMYEGGMGSFTDLVLQRDLKMLVDENDKLAALKHELYNACLKHLTRHKINPK